MIAGAGDGAARERIRHSLRESPRRVDFSAAAVRGDGGGLGGKPVKFSRLYYRTRRGGYTAVTGGHAAGCGAGFAGYRRRNRERVLTGRSIGGAV